MTDLYYTLVTDGSSDSVLTFHLTWLLRQHLRAEATVQSQWADLRSLRDPPHGLAARIRAAVDLYPCDILFIHRDAEREEPTRRCEEIGVAVAELGRELSFVSVVPVRMTEAWLLFDTKAVRHASGNPNGRAPLLLPVSAAEDIVDPKALLYEALRSASGLAGRRLKKFNAGQAVYRVAEQIEDFSPLRRLPAFSTLENDVRLIVRRLGWT